MSLLQRLSEEFPNSPASARLKAALLFSGVRYHPCLPDTANWAFPNYRSYILPPGTPDFEGRREVTIPYLLRTEDDTQVRLRIKPDSPFEVRPDDGALGYAVYEENVRLCATTFEPKLAWTELLTSDGTAMKATGLSQHGEMLVLNVAPGCEYFLAPGEAGRTENLSCGFCLYGLPDQRMKALGQELFVINTPQPTLDRVFEACAHPDTRAKQLYLVGGSMLKMEDEGERFARIAEQLAETGLAERYYVACGSGAVPKVHMKRMRDAGVRGACFNLEVWDPVQFERLCPGKAKFVGRSKWINALEDAVDVFGEGNVMTAFVGGAELEGEGAFSSTGRALDSAVECGEYLIPRGIQPIYSLFWRVTGKHRDEEPVYTLDFFLRLNQALRDIRQREGRLINQAFLSRRSAYMQLEPDYDFPVTAE